MAKDLEWKTYEERLRPLGVLSPEQSRLRGGLMAAAAPHREGRAALSSALCDSNRARGNGMELRQGRAAGGEGKGLHGTGCTGQQAQPECWS